jgi:hypothetical protein
MRMRHRRRLVGSRERRSLPRNGPNDRWRVRSIVRIRLVRRSPTARILMPIHLEVSTVASWIDAK